MNAFAHLETPLDEAPLFPVEAPDGRKDLAEIDRQVMFRKYLSNLAPAVMSYANPNAAKRGFKAQHQARKEGLTAGVFDMTCAWGIDASTLPDCDVSVCWIEFKGYDSNGRPGKLSQAQIDWGNAMVRKGHKVACFFSGKSAFDWMASLGAPIRGHVTA
ncbi:MULTISPECIES: hypothetical protein [unclassified Novosphingobium]|uniref:hypothetical protein n=1 Tax=unclassified Novosphingobium TaxID=2644732 RepID=UPI001356A45B|nr:MULTISPECIES: hypothetical protein [unclassified Novosphingobium]